MFFKLVGQRPETIEKLAATSESKFCYLIMATKQHLFFQKKKLNFIYINSQLNLINNLFCYLSRLSSRFTPKYRPTLRLYRPIPVYDATIFVFWACNIYNECLEHNHDMSIFEVPR